MTAARRKAEFERLAAQADAGARRYDAVAAYDEKRGSPERAAQHRAMADEERRAAKDLRREIAALSTP